MSMEQAILEHAAALREVAEAIRKLGHGSAIAANIEQRAAGYEAIAAVPLAEKTNKPAENPAETATSEIKAVSEEIETKDTVDSNPLDFVRDVRPALLAAIKKAGKPAVQKLLADFGVEKADKLDPKDFPAVFVAAQEMAG